MRGNFILQDIVLNQIRRERSVATFGIVTGQTFSGTLRGFDCDTIIVDLKDERQVMIYKKNLIFVEPQAPVLIDTEKNG